MNKLTEILNHLENEVQQFAKDKLELKIVYRDPEDIHKEAEQAILDWIDKEIIGEDENYIVPRPLQGIDRLWLEGRAIGFHSGRNELRADMRKKLGR